MAREGKSHWGIGLVAVYGAFVCGILVMVYIASSQRVDLVSEIYYDQGLHYQERITSIENTKALKEKLTITVQPTGIHLQFPHVFLPVDIGGRITLYRPDNKQSDTSLDIVADTACSQQIAAALLRPGLWRVKVDWRARGVGYYAEQAVLIR
jgi:nitrogen fixation protein FixH